LFAASIGLPLLAKRGVDGGRGGINEKINKEKKPKKLQILIIFEIHKKIAPFPLVLFYLETK